MNFISNGNIYDSYFVEYGYKENLTLVVTLWFEARDNKQEFHTNYRNSIVDRKIEVSEATVAGVDYVESIVDELFTEEPSEHYFYPNIPIAFALNSKSLTRAIKTSDRITLKFDIIDYVYENEEDQEENYYYKRDIIDSCKFDLLLNG